MNGTNGNGNGNGRPRKPRVPTLVERALAGEVLQIHGDSSQTRCFCHVADTIRALEALMDEPATSGEIYNVGSTERVTILQVAERVRALTGSDSQLEYVPYDKVYGLGIEDMLHRQPSIEKIAAATGWTPERSLDAILSDVVAERRATLEPAAV